MLTPDQEMQTLPGGTLLQCAIDQPFVCPRCGGRHFGRHAISIDPIKLGDYECRGKECGWRGSEAECFPADHSGEAAKMIADADLRRREREENEGAMMADNDWDGMG